MAVGTWLAIQQPPSLMRGAPGKELAGLNTVFRQDQRVDSLHSRT